MNAESRQTLNVTFTGTLRIAHDELEQFLSRIPMSVPPAEKPRTPDMLKDDGRLPRLAFSVAETAQILGVSDISVYRLIQLGLLRSSLALRRKMISKTEIERFLKETASEEY